MVSRRSPLHTLTPWLTGIASAAVLLTHLPTSAAYWELALLYLVLTALALYYGVQLVDGRFSPAHVFGIVAFLSLPADAQPIMLWSQFLGGVLGSFLIIRTLQFRMRPAATLAGVTFVSGRVALSFYLAGALYNLLGVPLPFIPNPDNWIPDVLAMAVYASAYIAMSFVIFAAQVDSEGRSIARLLRESLFELLLTLILPVPFAVLAAALYTANLGTMAFALLIAGLMLSIIGLNRLTSTQSQMSRQLDELRTLAVVTQAMRSHLNLDTLLKTVYLQVSNLLDINDFLLALYQSDGVTLMFPLVFQDGTERTMSLNYRDPLLEYVLKTQSPLLIGDLLPPDARAAGLPMPDLSWLGVPLLAGGHTLGAIVVRSPRARRVFTPNDLRLLNIVAASASIAIENAQLYEQQTERVNQLADLNSISFLLTGTLSRDTVMDTVISSAQAISNAAAVAVYMFWDDAQTALALMRVSGMGTAFSADPPDPLLLAARTDAAPLGLMPPIVVRDVRADPRTDTLRPLMERERKAAWVELPLSVGDTDLGVLVVYYDQPQAFTGDRVEMLRSFATQAAQAINNARLYSQTDAALERRVEQLYALAAMGRLLTATMDLKQIGELVLNYATEATKVGTGAVLLKDETGGLRLIAQRGYPPETFEEMIALLEINRRSFASGQIARVDDVLLDTTDFVPLNPASRAQLAVPVLRGRDAIGVISLEGEQPAAFSDEDAHFVSQIASQVVIAIDNVRLFKRITDAFNRLTVILDAMEEGIILIDESGIVALANPRVDLIGLTPAALVNHRIEDLLRQPEHAELATRMGFPSPLALRTLVIEIHEPNKPLTFEAVEYAVEGTLGTLNIRRQIIPVSDRSGDAVGVLLVFYDQTEEKKLAQQREDFSRMIVHDLRSPLTAVTTSLKLIREIVPAGTDTRAMVEATTLTSQRAIRKLLSRVDSLLDVSKMESGELTLEIEPTDLAVIVETVCVELMPLASELNVTLRRIIPPQMPRLAVDGDKVERLLLNLVDNALKYTRQDTTVTVRASLPDAQRMVRIEVMDQGPGVPEDYKRRLFDRYVQIKGRRSTRGGVGLGLTFCRLVVEAHGGRIWIEDNPDGGSIFVCTLPAVRSPALPRFDDESGETERMPMGS